MGYRGVGGWGAGNQWSTKWGHQIGQHSTSLLSDRMLNAGSLHIFLHYFVSLPKKMRTLPWVTSYPWGTSDRASFQNSLPGRRAWLDFIPYLLPWVGALVWDTTSTDLQWSPLSSLPTSSCQCRDAHFSLLLLSVSSRSVNHFMHSLPRAVLIWKQPGKEMSPDTRGSTL